MNGVSVILLILIGAGIVCAILLRPKKSCSGDCSRCGADCGKKKDLDQKKG